MSLKTIDYQVIKELWNLYELEDGSKLKLKLVLINVIDEDSVDGKGTKGFSLQTDTVVGAVPSDDVMDSPSIEEMDDIQYKEIETDWNEYRLENGVKLYIKPAISQVNRHGEKDHRGLPIYGVQAHPLIKIKKNA
ncbi:MAG: hypothetical protein PWQ51_2044 [Methanolobus sp.]|nr:hypothetical protein [Methanolobus sp.]